MTSELKPLTLADYPPELQDAYNDPQGDIMWRSGIARAATILLNTRTPDLTMLESPEMEEKLAKILSWYPERGNLDCAKAVLAEIRKAMNQTGWDDA